MVFQERGGFLWLFEGPLLLWSSSEEQEVVNFTHPCHGRTTYRLLVEPTV